MENQSVVDETDDVPDVPIPVSEFPDDYSLKEADIAIPLEELPSSHVGGGRDRDDSSDAEDEIDGRDFDVDVSLPLSPKVLVTSKHTDVWS